MSACPEVVPERCWGRTVMSCLWIHVEELWLITLKRIGVLLSSVEW